MLSARLQGIFDLIPPGSRVADVGCDHGYLAVSLRLNEISPFVIATDLNPGPLAVARKNAEKYGVSTGFDTRLADGLAGVLPCEVDVIVLAGMGGQTMVEIIGCAGWLAQGDHRLIVQPQSKIPEFMDFLAESGFCILQQKLVQEGGKFYPIYLVAPGEMERPLGGEKYIHPSALGEAHLPAYLDLLLCKLKRRRDGLAQVEDSMEAQGEIGKIICDLEKIKKGE